MPEPKFQKDQRVYYRHGSFGGVPHPDDYGTVVDVTPVTHYSYTVRWDKGVPVEDEYAEDQLGSTEEARSMSAEELNEGIDAFLNVFEPTTPQERGLKVAVRNLKNANSPSDNN